MEGAASLALAALGAEWAGTACAACGLGKWPDSPFCRTCSIRLQRANMFKGWKARTGSTVAEIATDDDALKYWARWYDTCRDYLINTRNGGSRRRKEDNDE